MKQVCLKAFKSYDNVNTASWEQYMSNDYLDEDYDEANLNTEKDVNKLIIGYFENPIIGDEVMYCDEDHEQLWKSWYKCEIVYILDKEL